MSEQDVLLKIYRQFTHDEAVALLKQEISGLQFKMGEQKSEIAELQDLNKKYSKELLDAKNTIQVLNDCIDKKEEVQTIKDLRKGNQTISNKNKKLEADVKKWRDMYFNLVAKNNNNA